MHYLFSCESCENVEELIFSVNEIQDVQNGINGKEKPKCSKCGSDLKREYNSAHIKKFHGKITPSVVTTADGKVHKLNPNLYRI